LKAVPKEIISYVYKPRAKLFQIVFQLKDVPGALAEITASLARNKINILGGFVSGIEVTDEKDEMKRSLGLFVEAQNRDTTASQIKGLIQDSAYSSETTVQESKDGLIIDSLNFPLKLSQGQRAILMRSEVIAGSMNEIREIFNTGGDVMLYKQGFSAGKNDAEELIRVFGEGSILDRIEDLVHLYSSLGWGKARIVEIEFETLTAKIRIDENFECVGQQVKSKPHSQFVRGHLAGLSSHLFSTEMRCEEVKCTSMNDPYCEFLLSFQS
jgi:predicted hydrocarbon binding protein